MNLYFSGLIQSSHIQTVINRNEWVHYLYCDPNVALTNSNITTKQEN